MKQTPHWEQLELNGMFKKPGAETKKHERQVDERVSAVIEQQRSQKNPPLSQNRNQNLQMNS